MHLSSATVSDVFLFLLLGTKTQFSYVRIVSVDYLGLRGVKRELLLSLTKCQKKVCRDVLEEYEIGTLDVNGIDYDQVREKFNR